LSNLKSCFSRRTAIDTIIQKKVISVREKKAVKKLKLEFFGRNWDCLHIDFYKENGLTGAFVQEVTVITHVYIKRTNERV